ncbi:hypothetical protein [Mucilaginibacter gossypii]|uniref:Nuclear transport factor 2 family protein n=1 Tax=Mucilaginibacter gossypii TaxID=551996 RepID=A0A1G8M9L6_9SPHI|nr:hypothetical protein [Mucilaginibacter gossypii]SDI64679.1 hypothetical protein SAMN05192573_12636 [Mucilaginibacter gossypii]
MDEQQIPVALNAHWQASAAGEIHAEHEIYHDDVICDYPQSGERIFGRINLQALRGHHPGKPSGSVSGGCWEKVIPGSRDILLTIRSSWLTR